MRLKSHTIPRSFGTFVACGETTKSFCRRRRRFPIFAGATQGFSGAWGYDFFEKYLNGAEILFISIQKKCLICVNILTFMGVSYEFIEDQLWGPRKAEQIVENFFRFSSRSSRDCLSCLN